MVSTISIDKNKQFVSVFHNPFTAWVILVASLILTFTAYKISSNYALEKERIRFIDRAEEIKGAIIDRLNVYEQVLWGAVGFYHLYPQEMNREAWKKYVAMLQIDRNWPGIQGIGFAEPIKPHEKAAYIQKIQAEGFPDFTIRPEGERNMYSSITFLEPFDWRNQRAFGYDMWSNDVRKEAMTRSRDQGVAATSGIITLVQETQEDVQRGFLMYVPLYGTEDIPETLQEKRKSFRGWVYSPFRSGDLMKGILGSEDQLIDFEIYDGEEMKDEFLLYESHAHGDTRLPYEPLFKKMETIQLQGRNWTLYFHTPPDYIQKVASKEPMFVAIAGVIIDILLFYVIFSLYLINRKAEDIAGKMTKEINDKNKELTLAKSQAEDKRDVLQREVEKQTKELKDIAKSLEQEVEKRTKDLKEKMDDLERSNKLMVDRELKMVELKEEIKRLKGNQDHPPEGR